MKNQKEYWVVCFKNEKPVLPHDCNPEFEEDEGMLIYRSYAACKASCKYQRKLYDLRKLRPVPLSEIAE
jgi:hypothetical protein